MSLILITTRSLFWILLGILSTFLMAFATLSPMWLVGVQKLDDVESSTDGNYSALGKSSCKLKLASFNNTLLWPIN
jgi:hypothetical protein